MSLQLLVAPVLVCSRVLEWVIAKAPRAVKCTNYYVQLLKTILSMLKH